MNAEIKYIGNMKNAVILVSDRGVELTAIKFKSNCSSAVSFGNFFQSSGTHPL